MAPAAAAAASSTLLRAGTFSTARSGHCLPTRVAAASRTPAAARSPATTCLSVGARRRGAEAVRASAGGAAPATSLPAALLFDCDGVLVDTEKDGHRISFNETFAERELGVSWNVELYGELLKIGGGKERMTAYFNKTGWPAKSPKTDDERKEFIASLHKRKTELFMALIEKKLLPLRPGVQRLIDEALGKGVKVAVCSTSNEKAVSAIVSCLLGPDRAEKITIFAGDVVPRKKPDPAIYILASTTLGVDPSSCVVVEDSTIGLAAAKAAGMKCIVTKSGYTAEEDFGTADAVFDCIGDPPEVRFDLEFCANLLQTQFVS
ncbi:CBBY-like protein [Oryza brachyantha]|nr:CBBY-like protein [Oryza brachyantha]